MAILTDEFRWPVSATGYKWIKERLARQSELYRPTLMLLPEGDPLKNPPPTWYLPMRDQPALFRIFGDTVLSRDAIKSFADRFGGLGIEVMTDLPAIIPPEHGWQMPVMAETYLEWVNQILHMRQAIALWEMVTAGDLAGLAQVIFQGDSGLIVQPKAAWLVPDWTVPGEVEELPEAPPWFEGEEINVVAATPTLIVEERWQRHPSGRLRSADYFEAAAIAVESIANDYLPPRVECRLIIDERTGRPVLRNKPGSLSGALWLQFSEAISQDKRYRKCRQCGGWFEIPKRGARISREFCSNACRTKAYRERQEEARDLHAKGKSVKEIAAHFDTDVKTIRGWLKHKG